MGKAIGKHPLLQPAAAVAVHQPYDGSDRPPAGRECAWCREGGHFCQATGYVGDEEVCAACGRYELCEAVQAAERLLAGGSEPEDSQRYRPDPGHTVELTPEMRRPVTTPEYAGKDRVYAFPDSAMRRHGRPKTYVKCPYCGEEMGTGDLARHKPRCPSKPAQAAVAEAPVRESLTEAVEAESITAAATEDVAEVEGETVLETRLVADSQEEHQLNQVWALLTVEDRWTVLGEAVGVPCLTASVRQVMEHKKSVTI